MCLILQVLTMIALQLTTFIDAKGTMRITPYITIYEYSDLSCLKLHCYLAW